MNVSNVTKRRIMLAIVLSFGITIVLSTIPISKTTVSSFNPVIHTCIDYKTIICPPNSMCFYCLNTYTHAFPECCDVWVDRNYSLNYAACWEDFMIVHSNDIVNISDADIVIRECVKWDREEFLERMENLTENYEEKYNVSL